ncbi:hypothetical protein AAMO2058_000434200 [Amorphochlora amoebiformis]
MAANWAVFSAALLLSGALRGDAADSTDKNMRGNEVYHIPAVDSDAFLRPIWEAIDVDNDGIFSAKDTSSPSFKQRVRTALPGLNTALLEEYVSGGIQVSKNRFHEFLQRAAKRRVSKYGRPQLDPEDEDEEDYQENAKERENSDSQKYESNSQSSNTESSKALSSNTESSKAVSSNTESSKALTSNTESSKALSSNTESSKALSSNTESSKALSSNTESSKALSSNSESSKAQNSNSGSSKALSSNTESSKALTSNTESSKVLSANSESSKAQSSNSESSNAHIRPETKVSSSNFTSFVEVDSGVVPVSHTDKSEGKASSIHTQHSRRKKGIFGSISKGIKGLMKGLGLGMLYPKFASKDAKYKPPWASDDGCVTCQYLLEAAEVDLWQNGIHRFPGMSRRDWRERAKMYFGGSAWGKNISKTSEYMMDMVDANSAEFDLEPTVYPFAGVLPGLSRKEGSEHFNKIYASMDKTVDRICEQHIPTEFYKWCRWVYAVQPGIAFMLQFQGHRPDDICFAIGMCGRFTYLKKGKHSRFGTMGTSMAATMMRKLG